MARVAPNKKVDQTHFERMESISVSFPSPTTSHTCTSIKSIRPVTFFHLCNSNCTISPQTSTFLIPFRYVSHHSLFSLSTLPSITYAAYTLHWPSIAISPVPFFQERREWGYRVVGMMRCGADAWRYEKGGRLNCCWSVGGDDMELDGA